MKNYWSCSKFANALLKKYCIEKPLAATMEEWDEWRTKAEEKNKFVYWFVEDFLDDVQKFIFYPYTKYNDIRYYICNRWMRKTHYLKTNLNAGEWYDIDNRILHGLFETLVDFVEAEKAWMSVVWSKENAAKYGYVGLTTFLHRHGIKEWRSRQAG